MAHDRMTNDDQDRKMGRAGQEEDQELGKQSPGRNPNDQQSGQQGAGQQNKPAGLGEEDDDDFATGGSAGQKGRTPQGGQNR